ncbi:esterase/lipase family protein [Nocardia pseudobrasiliensis]|uniref:Triacylglycerol esterase/lipase EstA (Alpha/beta hydrolase family) n=1 Tax=Nocardia pseudobrasiliensis TaxID=45979 RepID=A0A370I9E9_9NOCA|nr:alpha/beta fold hydrolase [Nocardia pseudobrasiliensis]RDI67342.1 triacylglycerol esterase/lipase EstA (alpha/beta hydrolase family) [Nocardia pseudobrasiliensis]
MITGAAVCALVLGTGASALADPKSDDAPYHPAFVPTQYGPVQPEHLTASWYVKAHPDAAPLGANDFGCKPTAEHPRPVVLAHGTDASAYADWSAISPQIHDAGFCVFALNYGGKPGATSYGTEDLRLSVRQVGEFVDRVLAATGAPQVDLVGFSQGATVTRFYVNKAGGAEKVAQWIGLASPSYGGIMYGLVPAANAVPPLWDAFEKVTSKAAVQQAQGAPFMVELNAGGDTVAGVRYTTIGSRVDEMIQPFDNIALHGPGATNLVLQDLCPINLTGHFHMVYDPYVQRLLLNALDPDHAREPVCKFVPLGTGIPEVILGAHS